MKLRAIVLTLLVVLAAGARAATGELGTLAAALMGDTPMVEDLRRLTDEIGGRPTGSEANARSVEWALERFRSAGVSATTETFRLPARWLEIAATAEVHGDGIEIRPRIAAMPYSPPTPAGGLTAPLVDAGRGTGEDLERLGEALGGAVALVDTDPIEDLADLFASYTDGAAIEARLVGSGVAAIAYVGARERGALYRHNVALGPRNLHPMVVIEREQGQRLTRLLREGLALEITLDIAVDSAVGDESRNVVGEIPGTELDEFVVAGAHLDSWGLGTGALDNGSNVVMLIDIARQMARLGMRPRRTIRFVLFNGEEHGLHGSWGYVRSHADELDNHVMASSFDIGTGRITGFFTGGRDELIEIVDRALEPVAALGPFTQINAPVVGTDNFDFMMEGVPNLVALQESANYGPHYHASTDTFDKVDQRQLRLNAQVAAAVIWAFANEELDIERHDRARIEQLVESTDLADQMRSFGILEAWRAGERGRAD